MVALQLRRRGITDERVLAAMAAVPRELFVGPRRRASAYADAALSIGYGQTISQPWIVAAICQALALRGDETVLEIGGGSGYSAAILARLCAHVVSVELVPELARAARTALARAGVPGSRVELLVGDGSGGDPEGRSFEAIAVHAATPGRPRRLLAQLAPGGRLVAPVAGTGGETLTLFSRAEDPGDGLRETALAQCRFVPLLGVEGNRGIEARRGGSG